MEDSGRDVSFENWLRAVSQVKRQGTKCKEFSLLCDRYPRSAGSSYNQRVYKELAALETVLLQRSIRQYQKDLHEGLRDGEEEAVHYAWIRWKKQLKDLLFFQRNRDYPGEIREKMTGEIARNVEDFQKNLLKVMKRSMKLEPGPFLEEVYRSIQKKSFRSLVEPETD